QAGVAAQRAGDHAAAATAYRQAIAIESQLAGAWTNLAIALAALGEHAQAIEAANAALATPAMQDPSRRAHALHALGHAQMGAGMRAEAMEAFRQAIAADARQALAAVALADALADDGKPAEALVALSAARAAGAEGAHVEASMAVLQWIAGQREAAVEHATAALRIDPSIAEAKVVLGRDALERQRWGDAAQRFDEVVRARPDDADAFASLGYAYQRLGRHAEAVQAFDRAIALRPTHDSAHAHRGSTLEASGDAAGALEAYRAATEHGQGPAASAAHTKLAVEELKAGRLAEARALAERAVAEDGGNAHARFILGVACFRLGDRRCTSDPEQALITVDRERADGLRRLLAEE
ncbi:MAG: hypothetical protein RI990_245, partial [Planctomycetota bacterium]